MMQNNSEHYSNYYEIKDFIIGQGQFGDVKLALNKKTKQEQDCCVKILKKVITFGRLNTLPKREIEITNILKEKSHQNIVKILDVFHQENEVHIFMELCDFSLTKYCERKLETNQIKEFLSQIVEGYLFLQENNIIHRDIKPDNILIKQDQNKLIFKIGDFGLGKKFENQENSRWVGTVKYMAPEISQNDPKYDNRCDVFSLGIILLEMVIGQKIDRKRIDNSLQNSDIIHIFSNEFKRIDTFFKALLNKMIVYQQEKRLTWDKLKDIIHLGCLIEKQIAFPNKIHRVHSSTQNQNIFVKVIKNNSQNIQEQLKTQKTKFSISNIRKSKYYPDYMFIFLENYDNNLQKLMESKQFEAEEIYNFVIQIIEGCVALKDLNLQLYEITPENIFFSKSQQGPLIYKLTNFNYINQNPPIFDLKQIGWMIYAMMSHQQCSFLEFQQQFQDENNKIIQTIQQRGFVMMCLFNKVMAHNISLENLKIALANLLSAQKTIKPESNRPPLKPKLATPAIGGNLTQQNFKIQQVYCRSKTPNSLPIYQQTGYSPIKNNQSFNFNQISIHNQFMQQKINLKIIPSNQFQQVTPQAKCFDFQGQKKLNF